MFKLLKNVVTDQRTKLTFQMMAFNNCPSNLTVTQSSTQCNHGLYFVRIYLILSKEDWDMMCQPYSSNLKCVGLALNEVKEFHTTHLDEEEEK